MSASFSSADAWAALPNAEMRAALMMRLRSQGVRAVAVLRAMESVPRDAFLPRRYLDWASRDIALPIGHGQTTAEPSFIALAVEALACSEDSTVLEIGSGSGYVTALLAQVAGHVFGIERYQGLAEAAQARLAAQGLTHVAVAWGDGLVEVPLTHTFDRIIVHAALDALPELLLDRLAPGGVLIYPLRTGGNRRQDLVKITRTASGGLSQMRVCGARLQMAVPGRSLSL